MYRNLFLLQNPLRIFYLQATVNSRPWGYKSKLCKIIYQTSLCTKHGRGLIDKFYNTKFKRNIRNKIGSSFIVIIMITL